MLRPSHLLPAIAAGLLSAACTVTAQQAEVRPAPAWDLYADTWVATDDLGRVSPDNSTVGDPRDDRFVGMFYFLWLGEHTTTGPHNITRMVTENPDDPQWGPLFHFHHWDEPLFGFYRSSEAWVMRKHVAMMANAGVDVLIVDATNGFPYLDNAETLLDVMAGMRLRGMTTPRLAFFAHPNAAGQLFDSLYGSGRVVWTAPRDEYGTRVRNVEVDGGRLVFDLVGPGGGVESPADLGMPAAEVSSFAVSLGQSIPPNPVPAEVRLMWRRAGETGWEAGRSVSELVVAGSQNQRTVVFDVDASPAWEGEISRLRIEFPGSSSGTVSIDSISARRADGGIIGQYDWPFEDGQFHPNLWFWWEGAPLMLPVEVQDPPPAGVQEAFSLRWTWGLRRLTEPDTWSFIQLYPQDPGYSALDPGSVEFMVVSIAQQETYMTAPTAHGRSYHDGRQPPEPEWTTDGKNFAEQWERALEYDPRFIFVTGWNEWVAQRFEDDEGNSQFVDGYIAEFSRDIEPMKGGHRDNYYYQLVNFIRRYKGVRPAPEVEAVPIAVDGDFADWDQVRLEFRDTIGDVQQRIGTGWNQTVSFFNTTGRNDIERAKVATDGAKAFFYVQAGAPIVGTGGPRCMTLLVDTDADGATGWRGFDVAVNRAVFGRAERWDGNGWVDVGPVDIRTTGTEIELALSPTDLGLSRIPEVMTFKWADNYSESGAADDFTVFGDVAPDDRFRYVARFPAVGQNRWVTQ